MQTTSRLGFLLAFLLAVAGVWCVLLPFLWAHNLGQYLNLSYFDRLNLYVPELAVAAIVTISLFLVAFRRRSAVFGFALAAVTLPVLKMTIGSPTTGVWTVTLSLLALLTWRLHVFFKPKV